MKTSKDEVIADLYVCIENLKNVDNSNLDSLIADIKCQINKNDLCKSAYKSMLNSYKRAIQKECVYRLVEQILNEVNNFYRLLGLGFEHDSLDFPEFETVFKYNFITSHNNFFLKYDFQYPLLERNLTGFAMCYENTNNFIPQQENSNPRQSIIYDCIEQLKPCFDFRTYDYYFFNKETQKTQIELYKQVRIAGVNVLYDLIGKLKDSKKDDNKIELKYKLQAKELSYKTRTCTLCNSSIYDDVVRVAIQYGHNTNAINENSVRDLNKKIKNSLGLNTSVFGYSKKGQVTIKSNYHIEPIYIL